MKLKNSGALTAFFAATTLAALAYTTVQAQANISTFEVRDIRYDESLGTKLPLPTIPKTWRLISVSNGEKINSNTLWFQAADGNIYQLSGFMDGGRFILSSSALRLNAR